MSIASQALLRSTILRDEGIDAALALDLDRPLTDDKENEVEEHGKPGIKKSTASRAPILRASRADSAQPDDSIIVTDNVALTKQFNKAHDDNCAPIDENTSPEDELSTEKAATGGVQQSQGFSEIALVEVHSIFVKDNGPSHP